MTTGVSRGDPSRGAWLRGSQTAGSLARRGSRLREETPRSHLRETPRHKVDGRAPVARGGGSVRATTSVTW